MKQPQDFKILIACEESQAVCIEFRKLGFEAYSCDLLPCSGGHPEWHLQQDVTVVLQKEWDMVIAFPPCTHLSAAGAVYWKQKQADGRQQEAMSFFMSIINSDCSKISVENPPGIMSSYFRKPDQIINPFQFGDPFTKRTCLWLKGLPNLVATNIIKPKFAWSTSSWRGGVKKDGTRTKNELRCLHNGSVKRSKTFPGIAKAIATQWGSFLLSEPHPLPSPHPPL